MNKEEYKNLWVYIETEAGKAKNVGLELLGSGRVLADKLGEKLIAVIVGNNLEEAAKLVASYDVDEIILVEGDVYSHYNTDSYTNAMYQLVKRYKPSTILIGATNNGRDMGPRLACRLETGLTADCTGLDIDEKTGNVAWTRPAFGGNLMATILCPDTRPQIGTVRPGVFKKGAPDSERISPVIRENIAIPSEAARVKLLQTIRETAGALVDLEAAEIIVAGGRGLGKSENFSLVQKLAKVMGGAVAASRALVDAGWIGHSHQVGQTGKTVGPKIYVACGISGAIQHVAGMSSSDIVVAINNDPDAPIFNVADYCVVGDVCEVLPVLIEEIHCIKTKQ